VTEKERVDALLVAQGWFDSREKAKAAVMAGLVFCNGVRLEKAGMKIPADSVLTVKGNPLPYVSRGGLKLEKAISAFGLDLRGAVMIDVGASTGGFTDCALKHGAAFVYAIDSGTNQLDWSLRKDERVRAMERFNFRYIRPEDLQGPPPDCAAIDVSFISLRLILPPLWPLLPPEAPVVALVKPQFEAGREAVGKRGVVRDPAVHRDVLLRVLGFAAESGFRFEGITHSPITGGDGNIEFLVLWRRADGSAAPPGDAEALVRRAVAAAHEDLLQSREKQEPPPPDAK